MWVINSSRCNTLPVNCDMQFNSTVNCDINDHYINFCSLSLCGYYYYPS